MLKQNYLQVYETVRGLGPLAPSKLDGLPDNKRVKTAGLTKADRRNIKKGTTSRL
jgi:hypothetical protein